jgi:hypothetical protein
MLISDSRQKEVKKMGEGRVGDFLKQDAATPLRASYLAVGLRLTIETNSESILRIAHATFQPMNGGPGTYPEIRLRLWVEEDRHSDDLRLKPYFRGLGHLVFSGFDSRSSLMMNLRNLCGAGRFTPELARDDKFWKTILFPSLFAIAGPTAGLTLLHCATVAWKGNGLLLAGESGSGKSTLSLALAQEGFAFLSDDRTLISDSHGKLLAWGLSPEMKQRAETVEHFPALKNLKPSQLSVGEPACRFDPVELFGISRVHSCDPRWIVFLERQSESAFSLCEISPEDAAHRLRRDLHQETTGTAEQQRRTIDSLLMSNCFRLCYGGSPREVAVALRHLVTGESSPRETIGSTSPKKSVQFETAPIDPLRRFRVTPLRSDLLLMGKHIRIETDSPAVLKYVAETFSSFEPAASGSPEFLWRIVCEKREEAVHSWPSMTAFCDRSLRYISLGQRSFIAVDLQAREAVGILPEFLALDLVGFTSVFLSRLFYLTSPALRLTPITAACVAKGEKGLLLFGPPNSGKTTSSYWAKKNLGMEFHADQAVFLELHSGTIRAWGEFWPAAFRPETAPYLPELSAIAHPFHYRDRSFLCMDKGSPIRGNAGSVIPLACIFLERCSETTPRLIRIPDEDTPIRFDLTAPFKDDAGSREDRDSIYQTLQRLPSYRLRYGDDPHMAATLFDSVWNAHPVAETPV